VIELDPDNKTGMWLCNALMVRKDITDEEKKSVTAIQRQIIADGKGFDPSEEEYFYLRKLWWRGRRDGKRKRIKASVMETLLLSSDGTTYVPSVIVMCEDCGHKEEAYGVGDASMKRAAIMLRRNCPYRERNFYSVNGG
jgi:hypothetical protein